MDRNKGFTLTELLVTIAIIAIVSAILLPVFASAKRNAQHIAWLDNSKQVAIGTQLYLQDYDDTFMIPQHHYDLGADQVNDRTWVQSMLPYVRNFDLFLCPADSTRSQSTSIFDPDLSPSDPSSKYYEASKRSNLGYNYTYLSPVVKERDWTPYPRTTSMVDSVSATLMFGDSAWEIINGKPRGGGNYLILPPCRYQLTDGRVTDSFDLRNRPNSQVFTGGLIWVEEPTPAKPWTSEAGGLYPWFKTSITLVFVDGHVERKPIDSVTAGCSVKPNWSGYIYDTGAYVWDLR
ncbi:MAG: prepilin-type N-terminal cleavage/methylation domain-containing protein [Fimbriimonadaceae bacterium]|nr:MAG: prepilin-type N-terminal cleavage/methylation domain-containing protein [Fimbriimonadaceae bacterium]